MSEIFNEKTIFWMLSGLAVFLILYVYLHRHHHRRFTLAVIFQTNNKSIFMSSVNSITLTDLNPHTGLIVMVDNFGNSYTGTLSVPVLSGFDASQDAVNVDGTTPNQLDVEGVTTSGGTNGTLTGTWTSQGNTTSRPNPNNTATKTFPPSEVIPDGQTFPALSCPVTVINKITLSFALQVNF